MDPEIRFFNESEKNTLCKALFIAEESVTEHFKLSQSQWRMHPYQVITMEGQDPRDGFSGAFAVVKRVRPSYLSEAWGKYLKDLYLICVQDHLVIKALKRDSDLQLLPLMVYTFVHELIHVVRFGRFLQLFDLSPEKRDEEEELVHSLTRKILWKVPLQGLKYVIDCYKEFQPADSWEEVRDAYLRIPLPSMP